MQRLRSDTGCEQTLVRVGKTSALRRRCLVPLILAAPAHAMMLLGDIGKREKVRERASDRDGALDGHRGEQVCEVVDVSLGGFTRSLREHADALDGVQ